MARRSSQGDRSTPDGSSLPGPGPAPFVARAPATRRSSSAPDGTRRRVDRGTQEMSRTEAKYSLWEVSEARNRAAIPRTSPRTARQASSGRGGAPHGASGVLVHRPGPAGPILRIRTGPVVHRSARRLRAEPGRMPRWSTRAPRAGPSVRIGATSHGTPVRVRRRAWVRGAGPPGRVVDIPARVRCRSVVCEGGRPPLPFPQRPG